jgi:hydroxymethylpyrimidine pyrophosphatase-like HAD family hydrolase
VRWEAGPFLSLEGIILTQREIQLRRDASGWDAESSAVANSVSSAPAWMLGLDGPLPSQLLRDELDFYLPYRWTLNPFPTFSELVTHLKSELRKLKQASADWQHAELMTNVFLLGCQLSDAIDDFRLGDHYDFSKIHGTLSFAGPMLSGMKSLLETPARLRPLRFPGLWKWRDAWETAMVRFLKNLVTGEASDQSALLDCRDRLLSLLAVKFPPALREFLPRIPSAFGSKDITHVDFLELARRFTGAFPDRQVPILVVGIRSAGSHFAPLLRAYLERKGYQDVEGVTVRPKRAVGSWEGAKLKRWTQRKGLAVVVDESPATGSTLGLTVRLLRGAGLAEKDIVFLLPIHPAGREWRRQPNFLGLDGIRTLVLEPEEWHKHRLLEPQCVETRLEEYFRSRGYTRVRVIEGERASRFNAELQRPSDQQWSSRLKRVFEVRLDSPSGETETRYVLAKSVGWGWLGYRALIIAAALAGFTPPALGLRDGVLYTEWIPQDPTRAQDSEDRAEIVDTLASYVAARTRELQLETDPSSHLCRTNRDNGHERIASVLGRAYGWKPATILKRPRLRHRLLPRTNPAPVLLDARMRRAEWIAGPASLLKTDFAQHGMGKHQHNLVDPAHDLAEAILHFRLSQQEECALLDRYIAETGDRNLRERLLAPKILAANWAMTVARDQLRDARLASRHAQFSEEYLHAWTFLVIQMARFCGGLCVRPDRPAWHSPLVILDIDGVLDRNVFGFPSTTAVGIRAVSLLHAHGFAMALNTARDLGQVQEYCRAYGFAGGVAEYGACFWDACAGREQPLLGPDSMKQIEHLQKALRQIPGVFFDDRYRYSIRAFTHGRDRTMPLPRILIQNLMESVGADLLELKQNETDTAIVAKEVDKGTGLSTLLESIGQPDLETVAIGDTLPDLPMFRVADRSFAPAQINCRAAARSLGCRIAKRSYQHGLLEIACFLVHPDGRRCPRCRDVENSWPRGKDLIVELLEVADRKRLALLLNALLDRMALQSFEA